MRFSRVVPLLPLASAFVITEPHVFENIQIEKNERSIIDNAQNVIDDAKNAIDGAFDKAHDVYDKVKDEAKTIYSKVHQAGADVDAWLQGSSFDDSVIDFDEHHDHPHHPPHHGKPHHPPHNDKPNRTVYEVSHYS
jgi:hypothetical protein